MAQDKTDTSGGEAGRGDAETVRSGARGVRGRRRDVSVGLFRCQAADERAVESHADTRAAVPLSSHPDASELLLNARVVVLAVHARAQAWCGAVPCPTTRVALQQLRANLEAAAGESKVEPPVASPRRKVVPLGLLEDPQDRRTGKASAGNLRVIGGGDGGGGRGPRGPR